MIHLRRAKAEDTDHPPSRLVTTLDPTATASEAYRTLRTNLLYSFVDNPPKVIMITSAGQQEGKSTTCANLGVVLAQADMSTLIVDCDLRKPTVHKIFELRNLHGVTDVLAGQRALEEACQEVQPGLKALSVGPIPPNPAELLGSKRFANLMVEMRQEFDYVLVDASPVGLVSDPAIVASQCDGVLLVLDAQHTRKGAFRQAMRSLEGVGANMLGIVVNNAAISKGTYYSYGEYKYGQQ